MTPSQASVSSSSQQAKTVDHHDDDDMKTPLLDTTKTNPLSKTSSSSSMVEDILLRRVSPVSLLLGILIGYFIQLSTMGANFFIMDVLSWSTSDDEHPESFERSTIELIAISVGWSMFTSTVAFVILGFLKQLVTITYQTMQQQQQQQEQDEDERVSNDDDLLDKILFSLECQFVVGSVVGVCMAWAVTNMYLGMPVPMCYSIATLVMALCWCWITSTWWFAPAASAAEEEQTALTLPIEAFLV